MGIDLRRRWQLLVERMKRDCDLCKRSFLSAKVKLYGRDKHLRLCNDCVIVIELL
jgi:hypothetical protein